MQTYNLYSTIIHALHTYICSYFTKDEIECCQAIMNAAKEAKQANLSIKDGLRKIGVANSFQVEEQEQ